MFYYLNLSQTLISEPPFLFKIVFNGRHQILKWPVKHCSTVKHPFLLCNIVLAEITGMFHYPLENPAM